MIKVGIRAIGGDEPLRAHEVGATLRVAWLEIDGHRIEHPFIDVELTPLGAEDVHETVVRFVGAAAVVHVDRFGDPLGVRPSSKMMAWLATEAQRLKDRATDDEVSAEEKANQMIAEARKRAEHLREQARDYLDRAGLNDFPKGDSE